MKTFDELLEMTDEKKLDYLSDEVENIISSAAPSNVLKLRALQSKIDRIRSKYKSRAVAASMIYSLMLDSLNELKVCLK